MKARWQHTFLAALALVAACSVPALAAPAAAPAASAPAAAPAAPAAAAASGTLKLDAAAASDDPAAIQLTAELRGADGNALGSKPVTFYAKTNVFGGVQVSLGTVATDAGGQATMRYKPVEVGLQSFTARADGAAPATAQIDAAKATPVYTQQPEPLASVRGALSVAIETLTIGVWVLLLSVLAWVWRGLPRLAAAEEGSVEAIEGGEIR